MRRADRLFEIIQILRRSKTSVTAAELAQQLETSTRTIYRDLAALQAYRTPIEGAAGVGYILRSSYDLPPLNFDSEEIEAIVVGLSLLSRTGDKGLQKAAAKVMRKIDTINDTQTRLHVSPYGVDVNEGKFLPQIRSSIRGAQALKVNYISLKDQTTTRIILPLAVIYYAEVNLLVAWCETRQDYRNFRVDRITEIIFLDRFFKDECEQLLKAWNEQDHQLYNMAKN